MFFCWRYYILKRIKRVAYRFTADCKKKKKKWKMNTKWNVPYGNSDAIFLFVYFIFKYSTGGLWISGL